MFFEGMNFYLRFCQIIVFMKEYNFEFGFVQMLYEKLAVSRHQGKPLYTYWDKKCLRFGHDSEEQFIHGLTSAKVIILLMSNKVWTA